MVVILGRRLSQLFLPRQPQRSIENYRASLPLPNRHNICKLCSFSSSATTPTPRTPQRQTSPLSRAPNTASISSQKRPPLASSSPVPNRYPFTTTAAPAAMSDQDYMAFLNKANEDPAAGVATGAGTDGGAQKKHPAFRATEDGVQVPEAIVKLCGGRHGGVYYTSDADEPFEAVALTWDEAGRGLPDEEEFAGLIQHWDPKNADVQIMDPAEWDPNGQYGEVLDAVREAGQGNDVRVYRIAREGVKAEYWVVTTEGKGKEAKLVGAKALAVES